MSKEKDPLLPYSFDLFFDIKYQSQLIEAYEGKIGVYDREYFEDMIDEYNLRDVVGKRKQINKTKLEKIKEILKNVLYWDSCPEKYKKTILELFPDIDYKKEINMKSFNTQLREAVSKVDGNEVGLVMYWTKEDIVSQAEDAGYIITDYPSFINEINDSDYFPSSGDDLIDKFSTSNYTKKKE